MSSDSLSIGIDFGTTNSRVAWYDPDIGRAEIIRNAEGEDKTPSLVYFGEEETLVGKPVEDLLNESEIYDEAEREVNVIDLPSPTRRAPKTHTLSGPRLYSRGALIRCPSADHPGAGGKARGVTGPSSSTQTTVEFGGGSV